VTLHDMIQKLMREGREVNFQGRYKTEFIENHIKVVSDRENEAKENLTPQYDPIINIEPPPSTENGPGNDEARV